MVLNTRGNHVGGIFTARFCLLLPKDGRHRRHVRTVALHLAPRHRVQPHRMEHCRTQR